MALGKGQFSMIPSQKGGRKNENVSLKRCSQVLEEMRRIQDLTENKTSNTINRTGIEPNIHEYVFFYGNVIFLSTIPISIKDNHSKANLLAN